MHAVIFDLMGENKGPTITGHPRPTSPRKPSLLSSLLIGFCVDSIRLDSNRLDSTRTTRHDHMAKTGAEGTVTSFVPCVGLQSARSLGTVALDMTLNQLVGADVGAMTC